MVGDQLTEGITLKQWFMLLAVATSDKREPDITDIAKDLGTSRQNASRILSALHRKGYLLLESSAEDRRRQCIWLTGEGKGMLEHVSTIGKGFIQRLFGGLDDEQVAAGVTLIRKLLQNLDQIEQEAQGEKG